MAEWTGFIRGCGISTGVVRCLRDTYRYTLSTSSSPHGLALSAVGKPAKTTIHYFFTYLSRVWSTEHAEHQSLFFSFSLQQTVDEWIRWWDLLAGVAGFLGSLGFFGFFFLFNFGLFCNDKWRVPELARFHNTLDLFLFLFPTNIPKHTR